MKCETKIVKPEPYFEAVFEGGLFATMAVIEFSLQKKMIRLSRVNKLVDEMHKLKYVLIQRERDNDIAEAIIEDNGWTVPDDMPIKLTVK